MIDETLERTSWTGGSSSIAKLQNDPASGKARAELEPAQEVRAWGPIRSRVRKLSRTDARHVAP